MHNQSELDEFSECSKWLEDFLRNFGLSLYFAGGQEEPWINSTGQLLFLAATDHHPIANVIDAFEKTILFALGDRVTSCGPISGMNSHNVASIVLMNVGEEIFLWMSNTLGGVNSCPIWEEVPAEQQAAIATKEQSLQQLRGDGWLWLAEKLKTERMLLLRELVPDANGDDRQYSMQQLTAMSGCDSQTLNKYQRTLSLPTAGQGKRNWKCQHKNALMLFRHMSENGSSKEQRDAAKGAMDTIMKPK